MNLARTRSRGRIGALLGGALALLAVVVLAVLRPWAPLPEAAPAGAGEDGIVAPAPLTLPEHPRVLVFGDSWTYGSAATPLTDGYAYLLGGLLDGETIVDGIRASGYLRPGIDGPAYGARIAALDPALDPDLVIVQGSINDRDQGAAGYRAAVDAAWDRLVDIYPDARIVVFGPAPHEFPVSPGTTRIDHDLRSLAAARGWWYISPLAQEWITPANYLDLIDVDAGNKHPSDAGHRYLAERLAAALSELSAAPVTEAGGSQAPSEQ